jgi:hypothetical protein
MNIDILDIVLAIPCVLGLYIVYEIIKMGIERRR